MFQEGERTRINSRFKVRRAILLKIKFEIQEVRNWTPFVAWQCGKSIRADVEKLGILFGRTRDMLNGFGRPKKWAGPNQSEKRETCDLGQVLGCFWVLPNANQMLALSTGDQEQWGKSS